MVGARQVYAMLGNESLWELAVQSHSLLSELEIPHSICGGVAVCLHGYQRNTTDLDLIICPTDVARVKQLMADSGHHWNEAAREFRTTGGLAIQFLIAGEKAGRDSEVTVPEPIGEANVEQKEGLAVVNLARLIEMKLACGLGSLRRTHKDFADVVELIAIRNLNSSFARHLHKSLRGTFKELVKRASSS
ncbi:MAG: hypothetical protein ACK6A8_05775 [Planctomycetota bacterium]|jgi:hypothetical protein